MACLENTILNRRTLLQGGAASLALWSFLPKAAIAGTRDPRLLTIVLRGGLDGLALCAPVGDPDYVRLRGNIALAKEGAAASLPLDSMFALNPNMPFLHGLYQRREAFIAHAVHTPYRDRSHFDGQDVLESGLPRTGKKDDGWLNRALEGLPHAGTTSTKGLAMGAVVPLVMRGRAPVLSWIPKVYNLPLRESTVTRLMDLYAHTDPALAKALLEGVEINRVAETEAATPAAGPKPQQPGVRSLREFTDAAEAAARFLSAADGPRIGALSYNGWDTHANEGVVQGQLGNRLAGLDAAIHALHDGLGSAWKETVLVIVTEFGRTVRVNGTQGTDHGMATVALFAGGAVNGGRVLADWPGLSDANLYEGRDLKPTTDLRALIKGVLKDHLGIPDRALASAVFPGSTAVKAADGLIV
jgi:uncharacterized protein (DUF1501 family)